MALRTRCNGPDALIGFMAATARAWAEATKAAQREVSIKHAKHGGKRAYRRATSH